MLLFCIRGDFVPTVPRSYLSYGSIFRASPQGVWGQPMKATAEKGDKIYSRPAELMVEELNKAFCYMESKEKLGYSDF
jgi:creatinine amidohydrolase